jgi:hypothetical protein
MTLLRKAVNEQAFLKAGLLGFPGSGKTYTASHLAIAISKSGMGGGKPVAFFDTETGSDFLIKRFEIEGVELLVAKSQAFKDLLDVGKEAQSSCSVLIVDSITHVWRELCEAYRRRKRVNRLEFQHWAEIKNEWAAWTALYLNSRLHIFVCGRAGYEYDIDVNEDTGKKELTKAGTKMKVEGEFGFEPSLLIEMERVSKGAEAGAGYWHRAHILKDRTDTINGRAFDFAKPAEIYREGDWQHTLTPFQPVFDALNLGGSQVGVDATRTSDEMFSEDSGGQARRATKVRIALETIETTLTMLWPGQDQKSKAMKLAAVEAVFGVRSWTAVEKMPLEALENGVLFLREIETVIKGRVDPLASADELLSLAQMLQDIRAEAAADAMAAAVL